MKIEVPMEIAWQPAWLSWVGSTTMCLNALGVQCDKADVAGHSGYAFALTVNDGLCPSGPTCLDWAALGTGVATLGRSVLSFLSLNCHVPGKETDATRAHARTVFELVTREVAEGRPCVVWGLGVPEFGVVSGVEGEEYLCVAGGPTPPRLRWDAVNAPGGPYLLAFPTRRDPATDTCENQECVRRALRMLTRPDYGPKSRCALRAYQFWSAELQAQHAMTWGNSYNAQCWAEARSLAQECLERGARKHTVLRPASEAMKKVAAPLRRIAELFPFTGKFETEPVGDPRAIAEAAGLLEEARAAESRVIEALRGAIEAGF